MFEQAQLYYYVFLFTITIMTFWSCNSFRNSYKTIAQNKDSFYIALVITLFLALFIGQRPPMNNFFGDSINYRHAFEMMKASTTLPLEEKGEWVWNQFTFWCAHVTDVSTYFTIIACGYFGFNLWACRRLASNNVLICLLFVFDAFSFYAYGTNGIRNGLACSLVLLFLSYLNGNKKDKIIAGVIAFIAFNIHHSTGLPILMAVISLFVIKKFNTAYSFWILSIFISLVAGGAVTEFFVGLGFDDRLSYLENEMDSTKFRHTGFRWDFLLYSMMPIVLGYYIVIKHKVYDKTYLLLLNTYTLSNAFWVMVIRASYSNRFAYLSWFMYPVVLAYPLLKLDIWGDIQGKYLRQIMFAQLAFTWFMHFIY